MSSILVAWIGHTDLRAAAGESTAGQGPIANAVQAREFDSVYLLSDHAVRQGREFASWVSSKTKAKVLVREARLSGPTEFGEIYENAVRVVLEALGDRPPETHLTFHLSPGTPAMAAVWIILAKTRFPAELIESSLKQGVRTVSVPFDISADYLPDLLRRPDEELVRLSQGLPPEAPEFDAILHRCAAMKRTIARARRVAPRSVPVLLEGESGTGKELLARAIHRASPRRDGPFLAVNCGAIPAELVESELFGHEKGAFTGAGVARTGYVEAASGGTLFLDEIGELPLPAQVKLLRVIQEGEVTRVGATRSRPVDVRWIAATHRNLLSEMVEGRFREDLFHRIAVAIIRVPPLREREGDLGVLIDRFLERINREAAGQPGHQDKGLSAGARSLLMRHPWPGNVRELHNTLQRAVIWSSGAAIEADDVRDALLSPSGRAQDQVMGRPLGEGLDLQALLADVARDYLARAMQESGGNKTQAAELLGLPSYQTLTNWLDRYSVEKLASRVHGGQRPKRSGSAT
mgnify:CR=1 FL=1